MDYEDHSMAFEDSVPAPMDLDSFRFGDHVDEVVYVSDGESGHARGGGGGGDYDNNLPRFPRLDDTEFPTLTKLSDRKLDETFGGEKGLDAFAIHVGMPMDTHEDEDVVDHRVSSYSGTSLEGICHSIVAEAGFAGLESPLKLRQFVSKAIAAGPLAEEKRLVPTAQYDASGGFARAFVGLSIAAYAQPSALVVNLPDNRHLVLLASGHEMVLIDPREQPVSMSRPLTTLPVISQGPAHGLPQLPKLDGNNGGTTGGLDGTGALVMRCHNHMEISDYILAHYKTHPSYASLYVLKDPQTLAAAAAEGISSSGKDSGSNEVTKSVEALTLDPAERTPSVAAIQATIAAVDVVVMEAPVSETKDETKKPEWQSKPNFKRLSDMYKNLETAASIVDAKGGVAVSDAIEAEITYAHTMKRLSDASKNGQISISVDGRARGAVATPVSAVVPEKNPEGKRERTPPSPPAMGSPVRMASDDEGAGGEKPKRAKTPPLAPVAESIATPVAGAGTGALATPTQAAAPTTAVKTERRKSAPKTARTSGTSVAAVPVTSTAAAKSK